MYHSQKFYATCKKAGMGPYTLYNYVMHSNAKFWKRLKTIRSGNRSMIAGVGNQGLGVIDYKGTQGNFGSNGNVLYVLIA